MQASDNLVFSESEISRECEVLREGESKDILNCIDNKTDQLVNHGFLKFKLSDADFPVESDMHAQLISLHNGSVYRNSKIKIINYIITAYTSDIYHVQKEDVPADDKKTIGEYISEMENLFPRTSDPVEFFQNFFNKLRSLDPENEDMIKLPYIILEQGLTINDEQRLGFRLDGLETPLMNFVQGPGITKPYTYISLCGSPFPLHVEDYSANSINVLFLMGFKIWAIIPPRCSMQVRQLVRDLCAEVTGESKQKLGLSLLQEKNLMIHPDVFRKAKIDFKIVCQQQGEIILTASDGFHQGTNSGFGVAKSVNLLCSDFRRQLNSIGNIRKKIIPLELKKGDVLKLRKIFDSFDQRRTEKPDIVSPQATPISVVLTSQDSNDTIIDIEPAHTLNKELPSGNPAITQHKTLSRIKDAEKPVRDSGRLAPISNKCDLCVKSFKRLYDLKRHWKTHFACEEKYECQQCTPASKYECKNSLNRHIKAEHENIKYVCLKCNKCFNYSDGLSKHTKKEVCLRKANLQSQPINL